MDSDKGFFKIGLRLSGPLSNWFNYFDIADLYELFEIFPKPAAGSQYPGSLTH